MHKRVRVLIVIILLFIILRSPLAVRAQESLSLSAVKVSLWPEFDRPNMLVIHRTTLPPQTTLPVELSLRIPTSATVNAVAARHPDGSLFNLTYSEDEIGGWKRVVFQATTPDVQIEYYDDALVMDGDQRHYEYQWLGDYAANSFVIEVQQPVDASAMRISPSLGAGVPGSDGLIYYSSEVGPLTGGQDFTIDIDYQKSSDTLSAGDVSVAPSEPLDESATGRNFSSVLPYLLGGLGVLLLVGGGYWYWRSGQEETPRSKRQRGARRRAGASPESGDVAEGHTYCHQCGKRASGGDRFCRACGTKLRI